MLENPFYIPGTSTVLRFIGATRIWNNFSIRTSVIEILQFSRKFFLLLVIEIPLFKAIYLRNGAR